MATIGPTMEKPEDLRRAIEEGVRWFRLPCGYRQRPHLENARAVRDAASQTGTPVALLMDLPSSRPRTGTMPELRLAEGEQFWFWDPETADARPPQDGMVSVPLPGLEELLVQLKPEHGMWFCDGRIRLVVERIESRCVRARLIQGTVPLKSSNSLFLPDSPSPFSAITAADRVLLQRIAEAKVRPDWVALSLIATAEDVRMAGEELRQVLGAGIRVMAKFETAAAVKCAKQILAESDGLMVARGDLGLAVGYVRLPGVQQMLVASARRARKPAVVATQVLETFADTGLPQRSELSDLSMIALQRASVVMLGKETVFSPRPIECIRLAREVLEYETRRFEREAHGVRTRSRASAK